MHDVKELYETVTRQAPPSPDALERQRKRQMRHVINRKLGAVAVVAAIAVVTVLALRASWGDGSHQPATPGATDAPFLPPHAPFLPPYATAPWFAPSATPEVDYVIDLNTGEMTPLPGAIIESLGERGPRADGRYAASPDGSTLAYAAPAADGRSQIFVANLDGSGIRQVTHDPVAAVSPAWSPDGTKIAYAGHTPGGVPGLFVLHLGGGETTTVIDGTHLWASPQFTPDGSSLLYVAGPNQRPLLHTVPIEGGESTLLFEPSGGINDSGNGSISPDGSLVTYLGSGTPASGEVEHCGPCRFVANVDGTGRRVIGGWMVNPAGTWSPDGTRIVSMDLLSTIVVVDVETGRGTKVSSGRSAIWLDDHTLLVEV
jgi:Tol biopolymer transport system component